MGYSSELGEHKAAISVLKNRSREQVLIFCIAPGFGN